MGLGLPFFLRCQHGWVQVIQRVETGKRPADTWRQEELTEQREFCWQVLAAVRWVVGDVFDSSARRPPDKR